MSARRPTLDEPVIVHQFWKNRKHDAIVVSLSTYEGRNLIDVRQHFMTKDGKLAPTSKGVAMVVLRLPDLAKAINKAVSKARELGLLDDEERAEV
jgi:Transcriptional Coactivator p15 (PC4)